MAAAELLVHRLSEHMDALRAAASQNPLLDLDLAEEVHRRLATIIERWDDLSDEDRAAVADTIEYVVNDDDEEHDILSPIGLEDDAEHVEALERRLGLTPPG
jgi:hypothetical protein